MTALTINGAVKEVKNISPDMPLLWVLRDILGMTGTKFGCGLGQCGACTVHLDGVAIRSCITPIQVAAGRKVTTIEGLGGPNGESPVQQAWMVHSVPQCGYCQPGQIMTAAAALTANQNATASELETAVAGNLCRCGSYPRIRAALRDLAAGKFR